MKRRPTHDDRLAIINALVTAEFGLADAVSQASNSPFRQLAMKRLATIHEAMERMEISTGFDADGVWKTKEKAA